MRWRVTGASMVPTLSEGDQVLVDPRAGAQPGVLVLLRHPTDPNLTLIKRVKQISDSGRIHVVGDNPTASTDSRRFGDLEADLILGRVTARLG